MQITNVNCPSNKYSIKCPYPMTPEYITIHNTANDASAMSEISYMLGNNMKTSFHAAVDNERVVTGLPFDRNGWHAGDGGNGAMTFHREKYVASGGPDGGDGGKGGDIVFMIDTNLSTLADFRYKRKHVAKRGGQGGTKNCTGMRADNVYVKVPMGTLVRDDVTGVVMSDLTEDGQVYDAAKG